MLRLELIPNIFPVTMFLVFRPISNIFFLKLADIFLITKTMSFILIVFTKIYIWIFLEKFSVSIFFSIIPLSVVYISILINVFPLAFPNSIQKITLIPISIRIIIYAFPSLSIWISFTWIFGSNFTMNIFSHPILLSFYIVSNISVTISISMSALSMNLKNFFY